MSALLDNLKEVGRMQAELKRRTMVYHVDWKERTAKRLELPYWAFHHMPWADLKILDDDEAARAWFKEHGAEAAEEEAASYAGAHAPEGQVDDLKKMCQEEAMKYVDGTKQVSGLRSDSGT